MVQSQTTDQLGPSIVLSRNLHALGKKHRLSLDQSLLFGAHTSFPDEAFHIWPKIIKAKGRSMAWEQFEKSLGGYVALGAEGLVVQDGTTEILVQYSEKALMTTVQAFRLTDYAKRELGS